MSRMKTFIIYAIIIVAFYFLSNILIYLFVKGTYKYITGEIASDNIEIVQAKATYINGYIDGKITNNLEEPIMNKFIKIEIYSKRGLNLGNKYIEISHLDAQETTDFHIGYKFTDSYRYKVSVVDNANEATDEEFLSDEVAWYAIGVLLVVAIFI